MKNSIFNAVCKTRYLALLVVLILTCGNVWGTLPNNPTWTATALSDIADDATIIIMSSTNHALPSTTANSSPAKISCTITTTNGISTITPASGTLQDLAWTVDKLTSTWKFYQEGSNSIRLYLSATNSNTALRVGSGSSNYDQFTMGSGGKLLKLNGQSRYVGPYVSGSDWRTYNSETAGNYSSSSLTFYVLNTGGDSDPAITTTSSMTAFGYNMSTGVPTKQSFTVSGSNLTNNVSVTPPTGYEICLTENGTYQDEAIVLSKGDGTLSATTIYVRLQSGISAGNYSGNIACSSTGATTQNVAVSGSVPFKVTWSTPDDATYATTYVAYATSPGTELGTLPSNPSTTCGGRSFYGWYDGESYTHATDAPAVVSESTKITSNKTYVAVFATSTGTPETWTKVTSAPSNWSGDYIITNAGGSNAMISDFYSGTSGEFKSSSVTISGSNITSTPTNKMIWTFAKNGNNDQYSLKNKSTGTYAKITGTSSTNAALDANAVWFTISCSSGTCIISSVTYSARAFAWYSSNSTFRTYSNSGNTYCNLYKKSGGTTYSDFTTVCAACAADPTEGSAALKGGFSLTSVGVTATGWDAGANCSWTDYGFVWGTSANPTVSNNKVQVGISGTTTTWDGTLTGPFTVGITYYFRAYGKNGKDGGAVQYSDDATFTPRQVSFNMHGHGGDAPANQVVNNGGKATDPGDPSEAGWTFGGWYNNDSYTGSAWDFSSNTVSGSSVTLHAKWTEKPKYTITLNAGNGTISDANWTNTSGSTYTRTQSNGDEAITLPTPSCNCSGWVFQGWSTTSKDNAASFTPDKEDGASFTPASDVTYYAVYRANATGGTTYNKITSTGDLTTGDYLFVSSTSYAMKNVVTNSRMDEVNGFTSSNSSQTTDNTNLVWTIVKINSQVVIKNGANYIGIDAGNNICLTTTPHFFTYTYVAGSNRWEFTSATKTSYQLVYNSYFKIGASQTTAIYLYKQGAGLTGNYYTNPSCSEITVTGAVSPAGSGTVTLTAGSGKTGDKVYAMYTPDEDYNFDHWSISGNGSTLGSTSEVVTEITIGTANTTVTANFVAKDWKTVTWKANGVALTGEDLGSASVKVENGFDITALPPSPDPCDGTSTTFIGWVEESDIWSGPTDDVSGVTIYEDVSDFPTVTDDVTYHAVWARQNGSAAPATYAGTGVFTKITTLDELEVGAHYVLYGIEDANPTTVCGAMNNSFINEASGKNVFGVSSVTISDNKITNPATTIVWKLGGTTDAYTLYSQNSSKYVEITANDTRGYTNPSSATTSFTITVSEGNFKIITNYASANSRMINIYSASAFRAYSYLSEGYTLNLYKYGSNYTYDKYLVKCCNTPTLAFAASPYAVLREDLGGASTTTWAEVDVTFTSNSSGEIRATKYSNATVTNGTAYVLAASKWQVYETTGGTLCGASHAYFEVLTQPSGATPGTGKFHVKTTSGQTGQGTYRIAITQAATDESHGNFCETTVYGFVDVTLRDKFVDNVNGNGTINRNGHGAQLATPTLSEFDTQEEDACHSEGRKLKGWIKETDLKAQYETGNSTRVQTVDGLCETCADGTDQTSLIVAPGANVTMSGATWYAVWAYEK